jgi:hypothetical protein
MNRSLNISASIAFVLTALGFVFKINHWPGAGPAMVLGMGVLGLYFLPAYAIYKTKEIPGKGLKWAMRFSFFCLVPVQLGILFKIQHWPLANFLILIPVLVFSVILIPALCFNKVRNSKTGSEKVMHLSGLSALSFFALGYGLKLQHMPGSGTFLGVGFLLLCAVFLPFYLRSMREERKVRTDGLVSLCLASVIISYLLLSALNTTSGAMLNSFVVVEDRISESTVDLTTKNKELYAAIPGSSGSKTMKSFEERKAKVKELSDALFHYVEDLKSEIKSEASGFSKAVADSTPLDDIGPKDNFDVPSHLLLGNDLENLREGKFSARELKNRISVYKMDLLSLIEDPARRKTLGSIIGLSTIDRRDPNTEIVSWEISNFNRIPLAATITILSQIQNNIRSAESEVLHCLRSTSFNSVLEIPVDSKGGGRADTVYVAPVKK